MKKLNIILIAGLLLPVGGLAAEPDKDFPAESTVLLKKLADWEKNEKDLLEAKIREKRISVVKILESHLKNATKAGNLKAANLLQAKIEALRPPEAKAASTPVGGGNTPVVVDPWEAVAGDWKLHEGRTGYIKLRFIDGKLELYAKGKDEPVFTQETRVQDNAVQYYIQPLKTWVPVTLGKRGRELSVKLGDVDAVYRK